jgi:hypothetical protein
MCMCMYAYVYVYACIYVFDRLSDDGTRVTLTELEKQVVEIAKDHTDLLLMVQVREPRVFVCVLVRVCVSMCICI